MEQENNFYRYTFELLESWGTSYKVKDAEWSNVLCAYTDAILKGWELGAVAVTVYQYDSADTCGSYHELAKMTL